MKRELKDFLQKVPKNIIVVIDGAYAEFVTNSCYSDGIDLVRIFPNLNHYKNFFQDICSCGIKIRLGLQLKRNNRELRKSKRTI